MTKNMQERPSTVIENSTNNDSSLSTVLIVDDEINILKSVKRIFRDAKYNLMFAENGLGALSILEKNNVDIVLSDMQMPAMSGAKLMEHIALQYPQIYRVIFTGFSDFESTIDAINLGRVHRIIQKPWNNDELKQAVDEGIHQVSLKKENQRLTNLVSKQNSMLTELNHNLEEKVNLRTKQVQLAMKRIERNNSSTHKMLFNFISITPTLDGGLALSISYSARQMAIALHLPEQEVNDVALAGLLCEIGMLGVDPSLHGKPITSLNYNEHKEVLEQVHIARSILGPATHLEGVIELIANQYEHFDGSGFPSKSANESIPVGARIIAIVRDYWRYSSARILPKTLDEIATKVEMKKYRGTIYDPTLFDLFTSKKVMISKRMIEKQISTDLLKPGMTLRHNIVNEKHILVLPEGHEFSNETIAKLKKFEKGIEQRLRLAVEMKTAKTPESNNQASQLET
jgi:response regulator RpfG family c-di-GMP phosphodiesterase